MRRNLFPKIESGLVRTCTPLAEACSRQLATPLGVLVVGAMSALACGVFVAPQGFVLAAAIIAVVAIGMVWPWIGLKGIACQIRFCHDRAVEGSLVPAIVSLHNRWPWPVWGLAVEEGLRSIDPGQSSVALAFAKIGGWSRSEFEWQFVPQCRGVYPKAQPYMTTEFPFGLWKSRAPVQVPKTLLVWPKTFPLGNLPLPAGDQVCLNVPSEVRLGAEGERMGARPFRISDSPRHIHWILTARHDRLIVSERQRAAQSSAIVTLDLDPEIHSGVDPEGTYEWAIRIGGSVCESLLNQGVAVTLAVSGQHLQLQPGVSSRRRLLDYLARLGSDPRGACARASHAKRSLPEFELTVTTDLANRNTQTRAIVLSVEGFRGRPAQTRLPTGSEWMYVPSMPAAAATVKSAWKRNGKEAWRGR